MSKDNTGSGLLSKLVKFVRNPTSNWSENAAPPADKEDSVNKQLLKEMMERKRRNDFVRKREFDMLRKIRKLEAANGQSQENLGKPSFFQSSMLSPDDRASTLKKIDEIEAQMSMQWWKNKDTGVGSNNTINPAAMQRGAPALTQPPRPLGAAPSAKSSTSAQSSAYMTTVPTQPASVSRIAELMRDPMVSPTAVERAALPTQAAPLGAANPYSSSGMSGLSNFKPSTASAGPSSPAAPEPEGNAHDAELEEAAILFANGDDAGAEAGLLELLAPGALRVNHVDTWLTLFDLYRATGEQEKFEAAALKFLKRFDRSAPQWFCLPDMLKAMTGIKEKAANASTTDWICASTVGVQTVAALNAAMKRAAMPWRLDWRNLKAIDPSALDALYKVFADWVAQPVQLQFLGSAQLLKVLLDMTPSGESATVQKWWLLRMQALRVLNLPDDFEIAALDFCVTYEVSPPAWESARCICIQIDDKGKAEGEAIVGDPVQSDLGSPNSDISELDDSRMGPQSVQAGLQLLSVELSGHIQGDAIGVLDTLEAKLAGASMVQISCTKLIRVDFSAAGMLLNWVSARQLENRPVKFSDVNRLVASFFNVIGITEYAKVVVRVD